MVGPLGNPNFHAWVDVSQFDVRNHAIILARLGNHKDLEMFRLISLSIS